MRNATSGLYPSAPFPPPVTGRKLVWRCAAVRRALWAYIDSELPPPARQDIETHFAICPRCVLEHAERAALTRAVRRMPLAHLGHRARARILSAIARAAGERNALSPGGAGSRATSRR